MALRRFGYIFIPVLAIILMSHNVSAYSYGSSASYPLKSCVSAIGNPVQKYITGVTGNGGCSMIQDGQTGGIGGWVTSASIVFNNTIPAPALITLEFTVNGSSTINSFEAQNAVLLNYDVEKYTDNLATFHVIATYYISSNTNNIYWSTDMFWVAGNARINVSRASVVLLFNDITAEQLTALQNALTTKLQSIDANIVIGDQRLMAIYNLLNEQGNSLDEIKDNVGERNQKEYDSVDNIDGQSASDIPGTDNQNTTNLIGIFSSFVSALGNASSTNCNFDGDFGNLDLGQMNFCRDDPPQIVQVIGSLVLIAVFVPLAYFLVNRIISEIRSFTNG